MPTGDTPAGNYSVYKTTQPTRLALFPAGSMSGKIGFPSLRLLVGGRRSVAYIVFAVKEVVVDGDRTEKTLCKVADVAPGTARRVQLEDHPGIAIYNLDGVFYATDDRCSHGKGSLSQGYIEGGIVECPFHSGQFDIRTGAAVTAPCVRPIKTYRVFVRDGCVLLDA